MPLILPKATKHISANKIRKKHCGGSKTAPECGVVVYKNHIQRFQCLKIQAYITMSFLHCP